jgi:hypothetical protein
MLQFRDWSLKASNTPLSTSKSRKAGHAGELILKWPQTSWSRVNMAVDCLGEVFNVTSCTPHHLSSFFAVFFGGSGQGEQGERKGVV